MATVNGDSVTMEQSHAIVPLTVVYEYVLTQIKSLAKSMKRRKIKAPIAEFFDIDMLTPEILNAVIQRIEIGHLTKKTKPAQAITIVWKLK